MTNSLPTFVQRPAEAVHLQPYACLSTQLYGFYFRGDAAVIQSRLVDPILNAPANGAVEYRVLTDLVLASFAFAARGTSTLPPDNGIGWVPENSWTIWIPLVAVKKELGLTIAERLVFYPAYICVDNSWSLAAGREVYGFPKGYGPLVIPKAGEPPTAFAASTLVMKTFGPGNEGVVAPLMSVKQTSDGSHDGPVWQDLESAVRAITHLWSEHSGRWTLPGPGLIVDILDLVLDKEVPGVFLKQFRDAADGSKACYQAIIEAGSFVTSFHSGGLLAGTYVATLADYASHPLASDLGVRPGEIDLFLPFQASFDFTIAAGREVWKADTRG